MIRRHFGALALVCALGSPSLVCAQQIDDGALNPNGTYRQTIPTEVLNPACPNAGGAGVPAVGVVGKSYGGTVCPPAGGAATITASLGAFAPTGQVSLSATTTSSNVALGSAGPTAVVTNNGSSTAYVTFGGAGLAANTSGYPVPAGWVVALSNGSNTYVAALSASGTDALTITTGVGLPAFAAPGSGGGGGAVSAAATSYAAGFSPDIGTSTDGPCTSDTATCDLLSRVARTNQNITALNTLLKSPGPGATNLGISGSAFALLTQGPGAADANSLRVAATIYLGGNVLSSGNQLPVADSTLLAAVNGPLPPQTTKQVDIGEVEQTIAAPVASTAAEACHVLKATAGLLYSVGGLAGQAEYFMVFNATAAPADGTVAPVWWGQAGAAGYWGVSFPNPISLSTGITVCASLTAPFTKTAISTGNVFSGQVQ